MCECKGSYVCPIHSPSVKNTTICRNTRGMSIRQAVVVMENNRIGKRFARNEETAVAATVLMGAYRKARKSTLKYSGSLSLAVSHFKNKQYKKLASSSSPEYIITKSNLGYYIFLSAENKYIDSTGNKQDHCIGAYFENLYLANVAVGKYKIIRDRSKRHVEIASTISGYSFTIERKLLRGGDNVINNAITKEDIAIALNKSNNGLVIEASQVMIQKPIIEIGLHTIKIQVSKDVVAYAKVWIVPAP